ncbi:MAG: hypothetical protein ACP5XB_24295 [Isosphaeraceae bacterium]
MTEENVPFHPASPRRFHLGDAMILIAALAVSTLILQSAHWFDSFPAWVALCYDHTLQLCHLRPWRFYFTRNVMLRMLVQEASSEVAVLLSCLLVSLVAALLIIRLRQPRPPLKQIVRQPVFGVCAAFTLGTFGVVDLDFFGISVTPTVLFLTSSVVMLWIVTGLPPWRPEPSWVDRAGRAAGVGWIAAFFLLWLANWLG